MHQIFIITSLCGQLTCAKKGVAGLTKRDIQLITDGGFQTVESVAYTPKRVLEQIKGISEQKATKILTEGKPGTPMLMSASYDLLGGQNRRIY